MYELFQLVLNNVTSKTNSFRLYDQIETQLRADVTFGILSD